MWDGVSAAFKNGVNTVIDAINWMLDKINIVLDFVLIPRIQPLQRLEVGGVVGQPQLLASGGRIGGGFVTNGPQAIVGEGRQAHPEFVIPTDPQYRSRALGLYEQLGTKLMADGGILGWIGGAASSVWSGITGAVSAVGGALSDVTKWIGSGAAGLIADTKSAIRATLPAGPLGDIGGGLVGKTLDGIQKLIEGAYAKQQAAAAVNTGVPGGGAAQWASVILRVLAELGQPANLLGAVERRINFESGGNPTAINLTDSNAKAGHPSQGLMQTIPSTFAAYAGPYAGLGITNPLANIYAGLNYAIHRYGSIAAIDPLVRPQGYAKGGIIGGAIPTRIGDTGGLVPHGSAVLNVSGRDERLLDPLNTSIFDTLRGNPGRPGPAVGSDGAAASMRMAEEMAGLRSDVKRLNSILAAGTGDTTVVVNGQENPVETAHATKLALRR